jgi:lipoic acid synthetase/lipoate-protein ligase A
MKQILVPSGRRLVWYLALEEYLAAHVKEELLFGWIVPPTVIFGRHQVMQNEVNVPWCQEHGVQMYRRKSGGGCVYADTGNLMLSYISPSQHSEEVFLHYLDFVSEALRAIGYPAVTSEHNDILVNGRKVSGNACYALPTGTIVHGTMLWDVDFAALQQAITPSREKLAKHGVESVRQRVANLKTVLLEGAVCAGRQEQVTDTAGLMRRMFALMCSSQEALSPQDVQAVDILERDYLDPAFITAL